MTLGSLRVRQDYLIAEGLLSPYANGTRDPPELAEWALARLRQLSAHEVGHTLGIAHNYYDSDAGRISVMDYPHPLVTLRPTAARSLQCLRRRDRRVGQDGHRLRLPALPRRRRRGRRARDDPGRGADAGPAVPRPTRTPTATRAPTWANGANRLRADPHDGGPATRAGSASARTPSGAARPLAIIEETLVPLFLHHRYQVEAAASAAWWTARRLRHAW